jgi:hypothetical protein
MEVSMAGSMCVTWARPCAPQTRPPNGRYTALRSVARYLLRESAINFDVDISTQMPLVDDEDIEHEVTFIASWRYQ